MHISFHIKALTINRKVPDLEVHKFRLLQVCRFFLMQQSFIFYTVVCCILERFKYQMWNYPLSLSNVWSLFQTFQPIHIQRCNSILSFQIILLSVEFEMELHELKCNFLSCTVTTYLYYCTCIIWQNATHCTLDFRRLWSST